MKKNTAITLTIVLFFAGILWNAVFPYAYLHEAGHVLAAFYTGGSGYISSGQEAITYGGWNLAIKLGGSLTVIFFGAIVLLVSTRFKRPFIGMFSWGMAHMEIIWFTNSKDQKYSGVSNGTWLFFILCFTMIIWALFIILLNKRGIIDNKRKSVYSVEAN